jgi:ankyrin repeat protein
LTEVLFQALFQAAEAGNPQIIEQAIDDHGADEIISMRNSVGEALMHIAASWGYFDSTGMQLLLRNGADVDMSNVDGETPLFVASSHDDFDMARLLIDNGADPNTVSCFGDAPWQHICRNGKLELPGSSFVLGE